MKKLISLFSLATLVSVGALSAQSSSIDLSDISTEKGGTTYIVTVNGDAKAESGVKNKKAVLNQVGYLLNEDSYTINYVYDTVLNGFSITLQNDSDIEIIKNIRGVALTQEDHTYERPDADVADADTTDADSNYAAEKLANYSAESMYATAQNVINAGATSSQGGKGIKIGILDTGLFVNQVAGTSERTAAEETATAGSFTLNDPAFEDLTSDQLTEDALDDEAIAAAGFTAGTNYVRINNKVPFAYDFADNDTDVNPGTSMTSTRAHGTHVASLAAANGKSFQGIAPNAQIAVLKVFGDNSSGASSSVIIQALNASAKLGLDVINLSLGTDLNDAEDDTVTLAAIQGCIEAGVIVNYAAGNSGKGNLAGSTGIVDYTTDTVETGYLGGSTVFDESANIVASSNPDKAFYSSVMLVGENAVSFSDQAVSNTSTTYETEHPLTELLNGASSAEFEYVRIGGYGDASDYTEASSAGVSVSGKIAVVDRGTTTFREKVINAQNAGATAIIVINNVAGVTFNMTMDLNGLNPDIPVVFVLQGSRSYFGEENTSGKLTIGQNTVQETPEGGVYSSYTSNGSTAGLDLSPTISAPGYNVIGAIDATSLESDSTSGLYGYDNMSGTSMATPNYTGALALALGEKKPENGSTLAVDTEAEFEEYKDKVSKIAMSTTYSVIDTTVDQNPASVRVQGAGIIDVETLLGANSYVTTTLNDDNLADSKAELKNDGTLNTDLSTDEEAYIEIPYTIHNDTDTAQTYKPTISVMIPLLQAQVSTSDYADMTADSKADIADSLPGTITMSINDEVLTVPEANYESGSTDSITVAANSTNTGTMKVRIDNIPVSKTFVTESEDNPETFSGTLREYFNKYFENAGGSYVEGFLIFENTSENGYDLNIPYMGFYGDYTKGDAVEPFQFEKEDGHLYNSELLDAYMKRLNDTYKKPNAYTGSTLATYGSSVSSNLISQIGSMSTAAVSTSNSAFRVATPDATNPTDIYAGATGVSDHIVTTFFVNRTLSSATWAIKSGSSTVSNGSISMLYPQSTSSYTTVSGYGLYKSWVTSSLYVYRGFADISVGSLAEGDYTLEFTFTKAAGGTQVKSYDLHIMKEEPELVSYTTRTSSTTGTTFLDLVLKNANVVYAGGGGNETTYDAETDTYTVSVRVSSSTSTLVLSMEDYAGNSSVALIHTDTFTWGVFGSSIESDYDFLTYRLSVSNGTVYYQVVVVDSDNNDVTLTDTYYVSIYIGTGLDASSLSITNSDGTAHAFSYDATSGVVIVTMTNGATDIIMNQMAVDYGSDPVTPGSSSGKDSSSGGSSSVIDSSTGGNSSDGSSSSSSSSGGCFGSVVASTSAVAALGLLAGGLLLKKQTSKKNKKSDDDKAE